MSIVDLEWVFVAAVVDMIVWELVSVEDVAGVALETLEIRGAVVGTLKEEDDISVVGTWDEDDDDVPVVGTWDEYDDDVSVVDTWEEDNDDIWEEDDDDVSEEGLLETLEAAASPVTLTTDITPKPAERVKFCEQQSCVSSLQLQAKVPCSPCPTMLQGMMLLPEFTEDDLISPSSLVKGIVRR